VGAERGTEEAVNAPKRGNTSRAFAQLKARALPEQPEGGVTGGTSFLNLKATKGGVSLHPAVRKMAAIRAEEENYRGVSTFISGLIVFDYFCGRPHLITAKLMKEPIAVRERIFAELLANPGKQSSWFEHRIEEIIDERHPKLAVVTTDAEGWITDVNAAFTQMCGYSLRELKGRKPGDLLQGPATEKAIVDAFRTAIRSGRAFNCTITNYRKGGAPYKVEIKMKPIRRKKRLVGFKAEERIVG
jgi:PAS domain S-box-containing protein